MPGHDIKLEVEDNNIRMEDIEEQPRSFLGAILSSIANVPLVIINFIRNNPHFILFLICVTCNVWYFWDTIIYYSELLEDIDRDTWIAAFVWVFITRYYRFAIGFWGNHVYRPSPMQQRELWTSRDVTVILPTIDPDNPKFAECILSILENRPAAILVVTVGAAMRQRCDDFLEHFRQEYPMTRIGVSAIPHPSKRRQVAHAVPKVETEFTILADDHVFWPSKEFVPNALAPFECPTVGVVATYKCVRRTSPGKFWSISSIINFIGCLYLERHNYDLRASNAVDGGVFVVSGRTAIYRTRFLKADGLMHRFCNEKFFFGLFGGKEGLGPDDDNFLTREAYKHDWDIKFQHTNECVIWTTIGDESLSKFRGQLVRWARTTFRSNPCMMLESNRVLIKRMPWSFFTVYLTGLINFALLLDGLLIFTFYNALGADEFLTTEMRNLLCFMLFTKVWKIVPHFLRYPSDLLLLPYQILFGYVHSLIKFWALITFWDCAWLGRNLDAVDDEAEHSRMPLNMDFSWGEVRPNSQSHGYYYY